MKDARVVGSSDCQATSFGQQISESRRMNTISYVVLILLVSAWTWVLGRPLLQNLLNTSHRDPVGHFNRQLSVLGQAPQHSLQSPRAFAGGFQAQSAKSRRLQWFLGFVLAAFVSLVLAVLVGGVFVWQHLLIDLSLVGYVVYAARAGSLERERSAKVTILRVVGNRSQAQPTFLRAVGDR